MKSIAIALVLALTSCGKEKKEKVAAIQPHLYEVTGLLLAIWWSRINATR